MQYVRNISDSVSTAWNSINPATLSGAIDVIVVEQDDGSLQCSPFHVRFGKFSLLRPYEKKVEFRVNGVKADYAMKLGEGGEAFFVFETTERIPQSLQTSPLVSPASSPPLQPDRTDTNLSEPDLLQLDGEGRPTRPGPSVLSTSAPRPNAFLTALPSSPEFSKGRPLSGDWGKHPSFSDEVLPTAARTHRSETSNERSESPEPSERSTSPPPLAPREAVKRAMVLSKELSAVNIPSHVTDTGDLMLDMTGFKHNEEDALRAEIMARKILAEELEGDYDIGALFGMDEHGNLWIYSSEEAKETAMKKTMESAALRPSPNLVLNDAASDPGYASDDSASSDPMPSHHRSESDVGQGIQTPPTTPGSSSSRTHGDPNRNYAKTLRLTSDQLKALNLKAGENHLSFTVNRSTCTAYMYLWKHNTPVVISDIDGTITKSDALGHVLNMIGRDWTHAGVAKLYSDIAANGYNIMYLTSRSVGQSDTTRAYLNGIAQNGHKLPRGPTILSPDRTMAALRREVYLRKPHIFKMATLRDIRNLYGLDRTPFYAGFGNRLTDQISYRTVDVPRNRIFTINSNAEVSLDLLTLNKLKMTYVNITEVVDHYFPPVGTLVKGGGEQYTDFTYWRDTPLEIDDFSASDTGDDEDMDEEDEADEEYAEEDDDDVGNLGDSYLSRGDEYEDAVEGDEAESVLSGATEGEEQLMDSIMDDEVADDEADEETVEIGKLESEQTEHRTPDPRKNSTEHKHMVAVQDIDAEIISGVKDLGWEKEIK